jgi:hypothetical protein
MAISMRCPGCQTRFEFADDLAGKRIKCKSCGDIFRVTEPAAARKGRDRDDDRPARRRDDDDDERPSGRYRKSDRDDEDSRRRRDDDSGDDQPRRRRLDDEDDRPRRRGIHPLWIAGPLGFVLLTGIVVLVIVLVKNKGKLGGTKTGDVVLAPAKTCPLEVPEKEVGLLVLPDNGGNTFGLVRKTETIPRKWSFEPYNLTAGGRVGRLDLAGVNDPKAVSLSPDGKQLLVTEVQGFGVGGEQWLWLYSLPDSRRIGDDKWVPFPRDNKHPFDAPALYRAEFVANDRILCLGTTRAFYSYHLPDFEVAAGGVPSTDRDALGKVWGGTPENFQRYQWQAAFSADRKKMAVWTGDNFVIVSTTDGVELIHTPSVRQLTQDIWPAAPTRERAHAGPAAFSPDGNTLAAVLTHDFGGKKHALCFWDTRESREAMWYPLAANQYNDAPGLSWWGNKTVVTYGARTDGMIIDVKKGIPRRQLMAPVYGHYGFSRDGKLWYAASDERTKPATLYVLDGFDPDQLTDPDDYEQIEELSQEYFLKRLWLEPGGLLKAPTREDPPLKQRLIRRP